jgi:ribosomal protein S6
MDELDRQDLRDDIRELKEGYYALVAILAANIPRRELEAGLTVINNVLSAKGEIAESKV